MRAMAIEKWGLDQLKLMELPIPEPLAHEVQIKVAFAGINPLDLKACEGMLQNLMPYQFPIILGCDAAGTISKVGSSVTHLEVGDEVYACIRPPLLKEGTFAEYVCCDAQVAVRKPSKLSLAAAAAIPLPALTAWQALIDIVKLKAGESILIQAGAGGVGGMAIQIARHLHANIFTTARKANLDYVKYLGANYPIDYARQDFVEAIKTVVPDGVDVLFDCLGGEVLEAGLQAMKPGGRIVTLLTEVEKIKAEKYQVESFALIAEPNGDQLKAIGELFEKREFTPLPVEEFPLIKAKEALEKLRTAHVRGKIILRVIPIP